jgi:hypothetical protein
MQVADHRSSDDRAEVLDGLTNRRVLAQGQMHPRLVVQGDEITPIRSRNARSCIRGIRGLGVLFMSMR